MNPQGTRFCEIWAAGDTCQKCKSLFYLEIGNICQPIDDPDCEDSDGIHNDCYVCNNNFNPPNSLIPVLCVPVYCAEVEHSTDNCSKCMEGFERVEYFISAASQNVKVRRIR